MWDLQSSGCHVELARHQVELANSCGSSLRFPQDQNLEDPELEKTASRAFHVSSRVDFCCLSFPHGPGTWRNPLCVVGKVVCSLSFPQDPPGFLGITRTWAEVSLEREESHRCHQCNGWVEWRPQHVNGVSLEVYCTPEQKPISEISLCTWGISTMKVHIFH